MPRPTELKLVMQLFKQQVEFFDIPSADMTPLQIREKLANIAAQMITGEQLIKFKDLLILKSSPNGGNGVTDDLKYTGLASHLLWQYSFDLTSFIVQSNSLGKMVCMFHLPLSGMVWWPIKYLALGEKKSGPNFLQRMLSPRCGGFSVGHKDKFDVISNVVNLNIRAKRRLVTSAMIMHHAS
jgi:hypothetical protein